MISGDEDRACARCMVRALYLQTCMMLFQLNRGLVHLNCGQTARRTSSTIYAIDVATWMIARFHIGLRGSKQHPMRPKVIVDPAGVATPSSPLTPLAPASGGCPDDQAAKPGPPPLKEFAVRIPPLVPLNAGLNHQYVEGSKLSHSQPFQRHSLKAFKK
jgi:hypothetical protein